MSHTPVLLKEVVKYLNVEANDVILDATLGGGGHYCEIAKLLGREGTMVGIDKDPLAIESFQKNMPEIDERVILLTDNFRNLKKRLLGVGIKRVNKALFDFGLSSDQLDDPLRGFSFQKDGPLDMRMNRKDLITAEIVVNDWEEETLINILKGYGEERYAKRIAQNIILERKKKRITRTTELAKIVENSVPKNRKKTKIHPATKTFQAIRISVNNEIDSIEEGIKGGWEVLEKGGRILAISFNSLEDRIVKNLFRDKKNKKEALLVTKKPIVPDHIEKKINPRSRSAKLRVIEKL